MLKNIKQSNLKVKDSGIIAYHNNIGILTYLTFVKQNMLFKNFLWVKLITMKKVIVLMLLGLPFSCFAQTSTVQTYIENYKGANSIMIPNIRELIAEKIDSGLITEARDIYNFTVGIYEPKGNLVFYKQEKIIISYLLGLYENIDFRIKEMQDPGVKFQIAYSENRAIKNYAKYDFFEANMLQKLVKKKDSILVDLNEKFKTEDDKKAILVLYFKYFIANKIPLSYATQYIYDEATYFLKKYPNSIYKNYVTDKILKRITPKKWRYGMDIAGGASFLTQSTNFRNTASPAINLNINFNYKKILFQAGYQIQEYNLNTTIAVKNDTWVKDSTLFSHQFKLMAHYFLYESKRLAILPSVGTAVAIINPAHSNDLQSTKTKIISHPAPVVGLKFMLKNIKSMDSYSTRRGGDAFNYCALNLSYSDFKFNNYSSFDNQQFTASFSIIAHLADISLFILPYRFAQNNRDYSW